MIIERLQRLPAALREAGVRVPVDRSARFAEAVSFLDLGSRAEVYWAGRATLCPNPADIPVYNACFVEVFGRDSGVGLAIVPQGTVVLAVSGFDAVSDHGEPIPAGSDVELLRSRDIAELSSAERERLRGQFAALRVHQPLRRGRRFQPAARGLIDWSATLREQMRRAGEASMPQRRRRRPRPAQIVLLVDVSGSMSPYVDALLRWAHQVVTRTHRCEVFTIGTRLSRVTDALRLQDPDFAMAAVGEAVPDWSGGTRLSESLGAFRTRWGRRGMARRAIVIIASDGFERADPAALGEEVEKLARLARVIVWVSPHSGKVGYRPVQGGIAAVLPHIDALVAGHSLEALQDVLDLLRH